VGQSGWAEVGDDTESPSLVGYASIDVISIAQEEKQSAIRDLGWMQVVAQSREEAYAPVSQSNEIASVIAAVIIVISIGYSAVVARAFVKPLTDLVGVARQLGAGDRDVRAWAKRRDEIGELADAFNTLADEVVITLDTLEHRVSERTMGLLTAAEVSRAASTVVESPDVMMNEVVNLTCERQNLYYVGLFLLDEDGQFAALHAGTGEAGRRMLEAEHKLEVSGNSMIGQCIAQNRARVVGNIDTEALHFSNPYLPETRTELALPLRARGQVIGAMTVQSVEENAFDREEITVFQIIADQVAIAVNNTQLFADVQHALREQEIALNEARAAQRRYVREAWEAYPKFASATQYETEPLGDAIQPEISQVVQHRSLLALQGNGHSDHSALVAPITVSEEIIGVLGVHDSDTSRYWTDEEMALFEAVVERVAMAVENRRLDEETRIAQHRTEAVLRETSALYQASQALVTAAGPRELLDAVSDYAMDAGAAFALLIYLDSDQTGAPEWGEVVAQRVHDQHDVPNMVGRRTLATDDPFTSLWLLNTDLPILAGDVETDTRLSDNARPFIEGMNVRAFVLLPLRSGRRWVGMVICSWFEPRTFTERDDRIYRTLRDQAAVAIDSQRLLRETEARALRERTLRQITERVRGATDPDAIVQIAVRELGSALNRPTFVRLGSTDELVRGPVRAAPDDAEEQEEQGGA
jgi:GAF domain-containing protein/HAMP domain-containing protein